MKFSDGLQFNTRGELRTERHRDGWYVLGWGYLIPVDSREDGETMMRILRGDERPNKADD